MYVNNVKLALPLHPELMFNENFIANHNVLFVWVVWEILTPVVTYFTSRNISRIFNLTILSFVALDI